MVVKEANGISAMRNMTANFFIKQIYLFAELCLDRNYVVMSQIEQLYSYEVLLTVIKTSVNDDLKGMAARLVMNLYVDREPQVHTNSLLTAY
jgi:hypothetical protein